MSLETKITTALKEAMKAKDALRLESLRSIKSAIILAKTESKDKDSLTKDEELKILQKLVKQRMDSAGIYKEQGREDLAVTEENQAKIISEFLPEQLSEEEVTEIISQIIADTNASGMKDMGKVMGMASKKIGGKADGKTIATIVKQKLA